MKKALLLAAVSIITLSGGLLGCVVRDDYDHDDRSAYHDSDRDRHDDRHDHDDHHDDRQGDDYH